jgi:hypothetical protein
VATNGKRAKVICAYSYKRCAVPDHLACSFAALRALSDYVGFDRFGPFAEFYPLDGLAIAPTR